MIDKKFGNWLVVKEAPKTGRLKRWVCRCSCGFETTFTTSYLNTKKATCCIECREKNKKKSEDEIVKKYLNKNIGDYTVVKYLGKNKYSSRMWLCRCKCGKEREFNTSYLTGNSLRTATQCKDCYNEDFELSNRVETYIPNRFWYRFLDHSKRRNKKVKVTKRYLYKLYEGQNKKCSLTGQDLYFTKLRTNFNRYTNASLDRIDNSIGYVKGNLQWVHKKVNMMKQQYSQDEFIEICKLIAKNN